MCFIHRPCGWSSACNQCLCYQPCSVASSPDKAMSSPLDLPCWSWQTQGWSRVYCLSDPVGGLTVVQVGCDRQIGVETVPQASVWVSLQTALWSHRSWYSGWALVEGQHWGHADGEGQPSFCCLHVREMRCPGPLSGLGFAGFLSGSWIPMMNLLVDTNSWLSKFLFLPASGHHINGAMDNEQAVLESHSLSVRHPSLPPLIPVQPEGTSWQTEPPGPASGQHRCLRGSQPDSTQEKHKHFTTRKTPDTTATKTTWCWATSHRLPGPAEV